MSSTFVLLLMVFCHIVDDYYLQGWLASAKQKEWWKENAPDALYQHDWLWALIMHAFSWTFMIMLPIAYFYDFYIGWLFIVVFGINVFCHAYTDNLKANARNINLWLDQIIHLFQIVLTFRIFM